MLEPADAGCVAATGDICGTASDTPGGVAKVEVSVQRASTQLYRSGSTFTSATPIWTTATGTTSWNYTLPASTFPAGDTYQVSVRATDTIGNARTRTRAISRKLRGLEAMPGEAAEVLLELPAVIAAADEED